MARFQAAIELRELMIAMQRQRLVRENPDAPPEETDQQLHDWVTRREPYPNEVSEPSE